MGTSPEAMTDKLGRRSGPRRKYTVAEKRAMVEETHRPGASVPEVAQRHRVNPNLLFIWRRQYRQGLLNENAPVKASSLLPVKVTTPTMLPSERASRSAPREGEPILEVEFANGRRLSLRGRLDRQLLRELIAALASR